MNYAKNSALRNFLFVILSLLFLEKSSKIKVITRVLEHKSDHAFMF